MIPVQSSMICAVGYDAKTRELEVVFNNGSVYRYQDVEKEDYEALLRAESKGRFMNERIVGVYNEYRVS